VDTPVLMTVAKGDNITSADLEGFSKAFGGRGLSWPDEGPIEGISVNSHGGIQSIGRGVSSRG